MALTKRIGRRRVKRTVRGTGRHQGNFDGLLVRPAHVGSLPLRDFGIEELRVGGGRIFDDGRIRTATWPSRLITVLPGVTCIRTDAHPDVVEVIAQELLPPANPVFKFLTSLFQLPRRGRHELPSNVGQANVAQISIAFRGPLSRVKVFVDQLNQSRRPSRIRQEFGKSIDCDGGPNSDRRSALGSRDVDRSRQASRGSACTPNELQSQGITSILP